MFIAPSWRDLARAYEIGNSVLFLKITKLGMRNDVNAWHYHLQGDGSHDMKETTCLEV
jgi:hypothetical protein